MANENIIEVVKGVHKANDGIRGVQCTLDSTVQQHVPSEHVRQKDSETYAIYFCRRNASESSTYIQCRARPYHLRRRVMSLKTRYPEFREVVSFGGVPNARTLASEFEKRIQSIGAEFSLKYQTITLHQGVTEERMIEIATDVFEERLEPAEDAREDYRPIELEMDASQERIVVHGAEEKFEDEYQDEYQDEKDEMFTELLQLRLPELKEIARAFPKDVKTFGGWSGKNKTHLVQWIIQRRLQ